MTANPLRHRWEAGEVAYGVGLAIPCAATAQLLAHAGFDRLMIDMGRPGRPDPRAGEQFEHMPLALQARGQGLQLGAVAGLGA